MNFLCPTSEIGEIGWPRILISFYVPSEKMFLASNDSAIFYLSEFNPSGSIDVFHWYGDYRWFDDRSVIPCLRLWRFSEKISFPRGFSHSHGLPRRWEIVRVHIYTHACIHKPSRIIMKYLEDFIFTTINKNIPESSSLHTSTRLDHYLLGSSINYLKCVSN